MPYKFNPFTNTFDIVPTGGMQGPQGPKGDKGDTGDTGPQGPAGIINTGEFDNRYVLSTGDQTISGLKNFLIRPTVNLTGILLSGEALSAIEQYVKNDEGNTIYKAQPVYVTGSNGNNILVRLASNTGESTSSKTFGLLKQNLNQNDHGYVITEGPIIGVDTAAANEGDPIWLGPSGNLIFGLENKPFAPNHLVYLGFVERKHPIQGKIFVKIQNGFELNELHNVQINHSRPLNNKDILQYDSTSGLWFNQTLSSNNLVFTTGDQEISGIKTFNQSFRINSIDVLNISGADLNLKNGSFYITGGNFYISGQPVATSVNLGSTGSNLQGQINNLGNTYATSVNLGSTGSNLQGQINNLGNTYVGLTSAQTIAGTKTFSSSSVFQNDIIVSGNIKATGTATFSSNVNIAGNSTIVGNLTVGGNRIDQTYATITNLGSTGSTLDSKINTLSGNKYFIQQAITNQATLNGGANLNNNYFNFTLAAYSSANGQRLKTALQDFTIKKAGIVFNQSSTTPTTATSGNLTFWNNTKNTERILITGLSTTADNNFYEFTATDLNVAVSSGDRWSFNLSGFSAAATNLRSYVDIYCYP